jgi:hypothetical protein
VKINYKMVGLSKVVRAMSGQVKRMRRKTRAGLRRGGYIILRRSKQMCPVETGNLRGSGSLTVIDEPKGPVLEIGYYDVDYAIVVHETPKNYTAPGTGWKYLERAVTEKQREALAVMRKEAQT